MAYTTGTAAHHADLLDKLRQWLTGTAGWTQLAWTQGATLTDVSQLSLQAPGAGPGREVYVNIQTFANTASSQYSLVMSAAIGYQPTSSWGNNPGEGPPVYLNLWQNPIDYWFYANNRRVVIVGKCSTNYMSAYAGMFLPWGDPTQYPFPLFVGGDCGQPFAWNYVDSSRRMFCDPTFINSKASGVIRDTDGTWQSILNQRGGNSNDYPYGNQRGSAFFMWPYGTACDANNDNAGWTGNINGSASSGQFDKFVATAQGERIIFPIHINHTARPACGALDGIFAPLGVGIVSEQTVSAGGRTLRAFQNIHRNSANDFFLIDEA